MIKKILFALLFLCVIQNCHLVSMDNHGSSGQIIDYKKFFNLCATKEPRAIKKFIKQYADLNINHQKKDFLTTASLYAAVWGKWDNVEYLLIECSADKMIKDRDGQTVFSKAIYKGTSLDPFKKALRIYSCDELNILCKTICLDRQADQELVYSIGADGDKVLKEQNKLKNLSENEKIAALHHACQYNHLPLVIRLLSCGMSFEETDEYGATAYNKLIDRYNKASAFVVREAFNNGCSVFLPIALVCKLFQVLDLDTARLIIRLYIACTLGNRCYESPKACSWKPVCVEACKIAGINESDEKRCLTKILLLPQRMLTEINIKLALKNK